MKTVILGCAFVVALAFNGSGQSVFTDGDLIKYNDDSCGLSLDKGTRFGRRLSSVGDLDGDGINELAVCAPLHSPAGASQSGVVYIFFFDEKGEIRARLDISEVSGGFGGKLTSSFAMDVAGVGDIDGNGMLDIAVSEQSADNGRGTVWILFLERIKPGSYLVKDWTKIHPDNGGGFSESSFYVGENFGNTVTGIGDLDQDGVPDIAVGVSRHEQEAGSIWITFLNNDGTVKRYQEISNAKGGLGYKLLEDDFFGVSITSLGDLNSDGTMDIAVGAHQANSSGQNEGAAYVLFLNKRGLVIKSQRISEGAGGLKTTISDKTFLGLGLDGESDLNADGINDLVMGGGGDGNFYQAVICYLDSNGMVTKYEELNEDSKPYATHFNSTSRLFTAIASMGDMNGDGIPEMAVGAMTEDDNGAFCLLMSGGVSTTMHHIRENDRTTVWQLKKKGHQYFLDGPDASYEVYSMTGQRLANVSKAVAGVPVKWQALNGLNPVVLVVFNGTEKEVYRLF